MNKKQLEKRCEDLQKSKDKLYYDNLDFIKQADGLKSKISSLEQDKKDILEQGNSKADFIKQILKILIGEAEINSKYQVIRDMFLEQIKECEMEKNPISRQQFQRNYPSDKIQAGRLW